MKHFKYLNSYKYWKLVEVFLEKNKRVAQACLKVDFTLDDYYTAQSTCDYETWRKYDRLTDELFAAVTEANKSYSEMIKADEDEKED